VVSAWYPLVSHVDNRSQIYVWPTPFYAEDWGRGTDTVPDFASRAKCSICSFRFFDSGTDPNVFKRISSDFRLVKSRGGFALYEKTASP